MLLLHGFTGSRRSWPPVVMEALASRGYRPAPLDLPGHGRNAGERDPARFTLEATLREIGAAQRGGAAPVVGYSMGGRLALAFALAQPARVSRLVLESASPGLATEEERAERRASDEELASRLEREGIEAFVDAWESLPLFETQRALPGESLAAQRARRLANDPHSLAASLRGVGTGTLPSYWDALPALRVPTLLIAGALDRKFSRIARAMAEVLPDARLVVVPGAGHTVHLERPEAWVDAVLDFLAPEARSGASDEAFPGG